MAVTLVPHDPTWSEQFQAEARRLLQALGGWAWDGGEVFFVEHMGSTSIPNLVAKPWIDIAVAVYPFPLAQPFIKALESLGYSYKGELSKGGRQDFRYDSDKFHVHVFEAGGELSSDTLLFRNYLCDNNSARQRYEKCKLELAKRYPEDSRAYCKGKAPLIEELSREAHNWHIQRTEFKPVEFMANELQDVAVPWCIASGWGLDLLLNQPTRYHADLDVCIWRNDQQHVLRHLQARGWQLYVPVKGKYRPWQEDEFLELPLIQIHARRNEMPFELLDILLAEETKDTWVYRREPNITMPKENVMLRSAQGFPILNPAITLLFKSRTAGRDPRVKDQQDFERTLSVLTDDQRRWLEAALQRWLPEHPWRERLNS